MSFNFFWRFTGLCLFVPRYEIYARYPDSNTPNENTESYRHHHNRMRVLLVDALGPGYSYPSMGHHHHRGETHEPHVPVLVCPYESVRSSERKPDATFYATDPFMSSTGTRMAVFFLDDQDLYRTHVEECSLRIVHYDHTGTGCAPEPLTVIDPPNTPYNSFDWVAPFAKISPGSESVRDECFTDGAYEYVDPSVIARVSLTRGELRTLRMAMDGTPEILHWSFRVPGRRRRIRHTQSIADVVELRDDVVGYVELTTALIRDARNPRTKEIYREAHYNPLKIRIDPVETKDGRRAIFAWVQNMPWLDILGTRHGEPPRRRPPDVHFAHFYDLSNDFDEANVPHVLGRCGYPDQVHQGNPTCPPAQAAAHPLA